MQRDEARRLVWADELLERGDPRGELITTQCALARGDLPRADSLRLRRRETQLLEEVEKVGGLFGLVGTWTWTRGAIEEITTRPSVFLEHRAEIFEKAPFLHRLILIGLPNDPRDAAAEIEAVLDDERIDGLGLGTANDPALLVELAAHLPGLRSIGLQGLSLGMAIRNEGFRNLDELWLQNLWDPFAARSAEATLVRPRRLRLHSNSQQKRTVELESLAHEDFFARLEDLDLEWFVRPDVFVRGSQALLRRLRKLRLPMGVASAPFTLAANLDDLEHLEELTISFFGNEEEIDLSALITGEHFRNLRVLRIGPGLSTNDTVRAVIRSPLARTLEVLDLGRNRWHLDPDIDWDGIVLT